MALNLLQVILEFLRAYPVASIGSILLSLILTPLNGILIPHIHGTIVTAIQAAEGYTRVLSKVITIILLLVIAELGVIAKEFIDTHMEPRLYDFVKTRMVEAVIRKYDGDLAEPKTGQVVSKIVRSPVILAWWASSFMAYLLPQIISLLFSFFYFLYYDWMLAASLLLMVLGVVVLVFIAPSRCMDESVRRERALDAVHEDIEDLLRNLVSVYSSSTADPEVQRLRDAGSKYIDAHMNSNFCLLKYKIIGAPLVIAFFALVTLRSYHLVRMDKITTGNFVSIFTIANGLIATLSWVVSLIKDVTTDGGAIVDTHDVFNQLTLQTQSVRSVLSGHPRDKAVPKTSGIGLYRVTYVHHDQRPLLHNLNLHFDRGEVTAIVGEIGGGKSTLLKLIMAFVRPRSGDLYIDGEWYSNLRPADIRTRVAYMPQECILFNRTIAENILYGAPEGVSIQHARAMMARLDVLDEFEQQMPEGLNTMAGKNGSRLSGGQRQLIWLMRILVRRPAYIILDEPTTSVDARTKALMMRMLQEAALRCTIIMVTHDKELVRMATRVVVWGEEQRGNKGKHSSAEHPIVGKKNSERY